MQTKKELRPQNQPNETILLAEFCAVNNLMYRHAIDGVQVGKFSPEDENEIIYKTFTDIDALVLWM